VKAPAGVAGHPKRRKGFPMKATENSAAGLCRKEEPGEAARPLQAGQEPKRPAPERKILCLTKSDDNKLVAASPVLASRKKGCILQTVYSEARCVTDSCIFEWIRIWVRDIIA
jgi:hypothetical protein